MFRVYVNKNIELDINDTLDYLYDEFGIEYTEDIKNRILQQIEFLEQNALAKNIEPEIKTYKRTYYNARKIGYRDYYLIYYVYDHLVEIVGFSYKVK